MERHVQYLAHTTFRKDTKHFENNQMIYHLIDRVIKHHSVGKFCVGNFVLFMQSCLEGKL